MLAQDLLGEWIYRNGQTRTCGPESVALAAVANLLGPLFLCAASKPWASPRLDIVADDKSAPGEGVFLEEGLAQR